jgi:hypothetical protein
MVAFMAKGLALLIPLLACASAAQAGASNFTLVNGTGAQLAELSIRRAGTDEWKPLGNAPAAGAGAPRELKYTDCAVGKRATVAGSGPVTWAGVNLCDVKSVTLKRDQSAGAWVDYDE